MSSDLQTRAAELRDQGCRMAYAIGYATLGKCNPPDHRSLKNERNVIRWHLTWPGRGGTIDAFQQVTNNRAVGAAMWSVRSPPLADVMVWT